MVTGYEETWKQATAHAKLPYIVPVSPGWDSTPWYGERAMVRTNSRPEKFRAMCEAAKKYVSPRLNAVISECWNEFGEGSYIEPTTQYGFGYLDAIRDAFCPDNPHHVDLTPQALGQTVPTYDEIPVFTDRDIAAQGGNRVYNPGFERKWGWVTFGGEDAHTDGTVVCMEALRGCFDGRPGDQVPEHGAGAAGAKDRGLGLGAYRAGSEGDGELRALRAGRQLAQALPGRRRGRRKHLAAGRARFHLG